MTGVEAPARSAAPEAPSRAPRDDAKAQATPSRLARYLVSRGWIHLVLVTFVGIFLFPFAYMVATSFKTDEELFDPDRLRRRRPAPHIGRSLDEPRHRRQPGAVRQLVVRLHARRAHPHQREDEDSDARQQDQVEPPARDKVLRQRRRRLAGTAERAEPFTPAHSAPTACSATVAAASDPAPARTGSTPSRWRNRGGRTGTPAGTGCTRRRASNRPAARRAS